MRDILHRRHGSDHIILPKAGSVPFVPVSSVMPPKPPVVQITDHAIIFLHHKVNEATLRHEALLRRYNPNVPFVTLSGSAIKLKGGMPARDLPWLNHVWKKVDDSTEKMFGQKPAWGHMDLMMYAFWHSKLVRAQRYFFIEWDVKCQVNLKEFFKPEWDFDLMTVAGASRQEHNNPRWWKMFKYGNLPPQLRGSAGFANPLCVTMFSDKLLSQICDLFEEFPRLVDVFSEMRVGTLARYLGSNYTTCERLCPYVSWSEDLVTYDPARLGIYHPVKRYP